MTDTKKTPFTHSIFSKKKVIFFDSFIHGISQVYGGQDFKYSYVSKNDDVPYPDHTDYILDHLCFVHGDKDDLLSGKRCVVRDQVVSFTYNCDMILPYFKDDPDAKPMHIYDIDEGEDRHGLDHVCVHLDNGHVILVLSKTYSGNSVIAYK